jgi:hypothetical protein
MATAVSNTCMHMRRDDLRSNMEEGRGGMQVEPHDGLKAGEGRLSGDVGSRNHDQPSGAEPIVACQCQRRREHWQPRRGRHLNPHVMVVVARSSGNPKRPLWPRWPCTKRDTRSPRPVVTSPSPPSRVEPTKPDRGPTPDTACRRRRWGW